MYSDKDMIDANRRVSGVLKRWIPVLALMLAAFVAALILRIQPLAYAGAVGLFIAACFGFTFCLLPQLRYRRFLEDMQKGLSRQMQGRIVAVAPEAEAEYHDGARVLPVRILLDEAPSQPVRRLDDETKNERIVYLNISKRAGFPEPGADVRVKLFGRHIREIEAL